MSAFGLNLESSLKTYGITGHPLIDSMIFAQLIPLIFAYGSLLTQAFKYVATVIFNYIVKYFSEKYLKKFMSANIVLYTEIKSSHTSLYHFMVNDILTNDDIHSDKNSIQFMDVISEFMESKKNASKDNNASYYYDTTKWNAEYDMYVANTTAEDGSRISYSKSWKRNDLNEDISKTFLYNKLIIKIALLGKSTNNSRITVTIYQIKSDKEIKFKLCMFEEFLHDRFNFETKIPIIQTIEVKSSCMNRQLAVFLASNMLDPALGLLNCGDGIYDGVVKDANAKSDIPSDTFNFVRATTKDNNNIVFDDSIKDYTNKLKFECYTTSQTKCDDTFSGLYIKYIGSHGASLLSAYTYGYFYHNNTIVMIYRKGSNYHISVISHHKISTLNELIKLLNDCLTCKISNNKKTEKMVKMPINIFKRIDGEWRIYELDIRSFETIYLPEKVMAEITYEFEKFSEMKGLYKMYQIPYRKGILFYGPPGTGKTSLVKALAYEHQMNIYVINVNDSDVNDDSIGNILSSIGKSGSKILLFEDIDSAFSDKEVVKHGNKDVSDDKDETSESLRKVNVSGDDNKTNKTDKKNKKDSYTTDNDNDNDNDDNDDSEDNTNASSSMHSKKRQQKFLTYSGLLNALDGVLSGHEGVITVMTTNYADKLGKAFLRPGRIDRKFNLTYCNDEQLYKMLHNFVKQRLSLMENALTESDNEDKKTKVQTNSFETEYADKNMRYLDYDYLDLRVRKFVDYLTTCSDTYTPAQIQQYLIRNIENIDNIFDNMCDIKESYDCT